MSDSPAGNVGERRYSFLHPVIDESESCSGIRYWANPDIVALEGFHEGFGHAVAVGAFDWREAGQQIERQSDLDGSVGGEDRAVVGQPPGAARGSFQPVNSSTSEHQRLFERIVAIWPRARARQRPHSYAVYFTVRSGRKSFFAKQSHLARRCLKI